ncbi:hypothetical protein HanXRQr2_Chr08g0360521 [Helianthus annuus]|uniref:Uncharacterized protein n=1 Tax=Helianthus annuus TaxID=4232 RepID=A0A9K3IHK4_HELAN|nr:hypothetical protein HanXRQr2_Chr08g0360521 [Helianthus annuus]
MYEPFIYFSGLLISEWAGFDPIQGLVYRARYEPFIYYLCIICVVFCSRSKRLE